MRINIIISLMLVCVGVFAQKSMTLSECQQQALQRNIAIRQANTDIRMSEETKESARSHYYPVVAASFNGFVSSKAVMDIGLPTLPFLGAMGMMDVAKNGTFGGVNAIMPIYVGGQIHNSNKLAELGIEVSKLRLLQSESEVKLTTAQYFWQLVMLKEKMNTIAAVDSQVVEIQKNVEVAIKAGVTINNDLLQVNLKQNELQSKRLSVLDGLGTSRMLLAQYIGMGLDSVDADYEVTYAMPPSPVTLYTAPSVALSQTPAYQLLMHKVKAEELQEKITLGKNLPTVALGGAFNYRNIIKKSESIMYDMVNVTIPKSSFIGFATLSVPISSWIGGRHDIRKQKLAVQKAQESLADNSELLQIKMSNCWNKVNESYQQLAICLKSIEQSKENLRLHNVQYKAGICTMSNLLEAQTLYQKSRDQFVEAFAQYQICQAQYLYAIGK